MEVIKDWSIILATIQSLVTILAIAGGVWLYLKRRQRFPRAKLSHQIFDKSLSENKILVKVIVTVANQGEVLLSIESGFVGIQQIQPCPKQILNSLSVKEELVKEGKREIGWDVIAHRDFNHGAKKFEIEPSEEDELCFDFIVDSGVKTVLVYSYFKNKKKRRHEIGWNKISMYDLSSSRK